MFKNYGLYILITIAGLFTSACSKSDPMQDVNKTINESINLLENGDAKTFVNKYIHPRDLDRIYKQLSQQKFMKQFKGGGFRKILDALKIIKNVKPVLSHNNKVATYRFQNRYNNPRSLLLIKHNKHWYPLRQVVAPKPFAARPDRG